ncbi:vacuolar protein sorting-associated protein 13A [Elysia marginata]|uniref:Vacuolar protein sorting-associated protein 13A n=1 Tax=Elysia marginata TaxID=1093978 RepID=A0AAV4IQQ1_9GAST|nr:vacuolar protein sorting-associated protein 13A [Elysia marginata]
MIAKDKVISLVFDEIAVSLAKNQCSSPISAVAHLRLNTKPELTDFCLPKIFLTLVFDEIAVSLAQNQYDDILEMLESMERMNLLAKYTKTRPAVAYSDTKAWLHHVFVAVLEHTVQHWRKMWRWTNIKQHRELCRQYRTVYAKKLDVGGGKLSSADSALIKAEKMGKKKQEEKESSGGWLGGWFGGGKKDKKKKEEEASDALELGENFLLVPGNALRGRRDSQLLKLSLTEICASFGQRPAANAIRLSNAAMARYDIIKAQTTASMVHMMDERKYADIEGRLPSTAQPWFVQHQQRENCRSHSRHTGS